MDNLLCMMVVMLFWWSEKGEVVAWVFIVTCHDYPDSPDPINREGAAWYQGTYTGTNNASQNVIHRMYIGCYSCHRRLPLMVPLVKSLVQQGMVHQPRLDLKVALGFVQLVTLSPVDVVDTNVITDHGDKNMTNWSVNVWYIVDVGSWPIAPCLVC